MSLLKILGIDKYTVKLKEWVNKRIDTKITDLVNSAPETLDTLGELATAIQENEDIINALDSAITNKANKSDIVTPDWNAQEGEAGYIENRTHGVFFVTKPELVNYNEQFEILKNKTPEITVEGNKYEAKYLVDDLSFWEDMGLILFEKNWETNNDSITDAFKNYWDFDAAGGTASFNITNESDDEDNYHVYITIKWYTEEDFFKDVNKILSSLLSSYYIIERASYWIKTLNADYLPDTVVKTTPQILSTVNKNQALTNLGIDPVVWKYMLNPFVVTMASNGSTLPSDLQNIIADEGGNLIPSVVFKCIIFNNSDAYYISTHIRSNFVTVNNQSFAYSQGKFTLIED